MANQSTTDNLKLEKTFDNSAYIYTVMPFQIFKGETGGLFDIVTDGVVRQNEMLEHVDYFSEKLSSYSESPGIKSHALGDFTKYYDFMRNHFGNHGEGRGLTVFKLNTSKLNPAAGYDSFKNMQAQFSNSATLGHSTIQMDGMDEVRVYINPEAAIGFLIFGFMCVTPDGNIADQLSKTEFFRNIGWRRNQKLGDTQIQKHQWKFNAEQASGLSMFETLNCYFSNFSDCIRFYQDRPIVLYSIASTTIGSKSNDELFELAYEIIRVPDKNAPRFENELTEPSVKRIGRHVAFTALNEGAMIIESVNQEVKVKGLANKYFPAFILTLNQRELLLKTMQSIAHLDTRELSGHNEAIFNKMENLRNRLLILQLKQIFYSVSNLHEVELFFNQLQKAFAVEKMLLENEQSVREMYNLLEVNRNNDIERIEKEKAELDERRSNIINTILGAIGCLGLFSFLKDLIPFYKDSATYMGWYRALSILLPIIVMTYIVRLVFYSKR